MGDLSLQNNNWQDVLSRINVEAPLNVIFTGDVIGNANIILTKFLPDGSRQPNNVLLIDCTMNANISAGITNVILIGDVISASGNANISNGILTITTTLSNTAVTQGTYGNSSYVSQVTVDTTGRVTQASNVKIAVGSLGGGRQSIYLPAGALKPANVEGCYPLISYSHGAGKPDSISLNFSGTANSSAFFSIAMPKNWDLGNITYRYIWTYREASATADNYNVLWALSAVSFSDGDSLNASLGTEVTVFDNAGLTGNANIICVTSESANVVIAGNPQENDFTVFRVRRIATDALDNYTGNAIFLGVKLFVGTTSLTED